MKFQALLGGLICLGLISCQKTTSTKSQVKTNKSTTGLDRLHLPIQPPQLAAVTEMDARKVPTPAPFKVEPPEGAPNVVLIMLDDIGFGATEIYGGEIKTPTLSKLASNGLRFNKFHTTALCSPTRAALLSGRNHHQVNVGL